MAAIKKGNFFRYRGDIYEIIRPEKYTSRVESVLGERQTYVSNKHITNSPEVTEHDLTRYINARTRRIRTSNPTKGGKSMAKVRVKPHMTTVKKRIGGRIRKVRVRVKGYLRKK